MRKGIGYLLAGVAIAAGCAGQPERISQPVYPVSQQAQNTVSTQNRNLVNVSQDGHQGSTEAEVFLRKFPEELPFSTIRKYPTEGARRCLIHLRQMHRNPTGAPESQESRWATRQVQRRIYEILDRLVNDGYIASVRDEGFGTLEDAKNLNESAKRFYETEKTETGDEFILGGALGLGAEGRINLKPCNTRESYNQTRKLIYLARSGKSAEEREEALIHEYREDVVLWLISNDADSASVVVFGAANEWGGQESCGPEYREGDLLGRTLSNKDNIAQWNRDHPDKKFSLIEISPW